MKSVSVVVPAYNAERFLSECLKAILAQSVDQVVVVDDGSSDQTLAVARSLGVETLALPHRGASAALNAGVAACRGDWLAFCDADDLWLPRRLALQCEELERQPDLEMLFGWVEQFGGDAPISRAPHRGTMLICRAAFERVGEFAELSTGEFLDWYSRARHAGLREFTVPAVVYRRRLHDQNLGLRSDPKDYLRVLKAHLDRHRSRV